MRWVGIFAVGTVACGRIGFAPLAIGDAGPAGDATDAASVASHEVQFGKTFNTANVAQLTVTLPQPTLAGDLVVVATTGFGAIASVDDNAPGGTSAYQGTNAIAMDSNQDYSDIWFAPASRAGATSVTVHMSVSNSLTVWVAEFAGFAASPLDSTAIWHDDAAVTMLTSPAMLVSVPGSLVFVMAGMSTNSVTPLSSTFTDLGEQNADDVAYEIAPTTGTYTAAWTLSPPGVYVTSAAVFTPAH